MLHEGDIAVGALTLVDALIFDAAQSLAIPTLKNQTHTLSYSYRVTPEDITRGKVENSALISGRDEKYNNELKDISGSSYENDEKTITGLNPCRVPEGSHVVNRKFKSPFHHAIKCLMISLNIRVGISLNQLVIAFHIGAYF